MYTSVFFFACYMSCHRMLRDLTQVVKFLIKYLDTGCGFTFLSLISFLHFVPKRALQMFIRVRYQFRTNAKPHVKFAIHTGVLVLLM